MAADPNRDRPITYRELVQFMEQYAISADAQNDNPGLVPATVESYNPTTRMVYVTLDPDAVVGGDPQEIPNLTYGIDLLPRDRVMVMFDQPRGAFVIGIIGLVNRAPVIPDAPMGWVVTGTLTLGHASLSFPAYSEAYDTDNFWPGGSNASVIMPSGTGGVWGVSIRSAISATPWRYFCQMVVNGVGPAIRNSGGLIADGGANPVDADSVISASHVLRLSAGDTITPQTFQSNSTSGTVSQSVWFEGWQIKSYEF